MPLTRRSFIGSIAAAAGAAASGRRLRADMLPQVGARGPSAALLPGVQLYTLRASMQQDVARTLSAVADIGYREVEFAGYFDRPATALRELLERNALTAPSAHVGLAQLRSRQTAVLDAARQLGHRYITVPSLTSAERGSRAAWRDVVRQLNEHGAAARQAGLGLAYHNHDYEFAPLDGAVLFDTLMTETDPALVSFQLDVYWAFRAGRDPLAVLAAHPGRITMMHLKDSGGPPAHVMSDVGAGVIDFGALLSRAPELGVRHAFVEHDRPDDAIATIRNSYRHLAALQR